MQCPTNGVQKDNFMEQKFTLVDKTYLYHKIFIVFQLAFKGNSQLLLSFQATKNEKYSKGGMGCNHRAWMYYKGRQQSAALVEACWPT